MIVIPMIYHTKETDLDASYIDPLCTVNTAIDPDTAWVKCPLVNNQFIGLGCCADFQQTSLESNFEQSDYIADFRSAAKKTRTSIWDLRKRCLLHQKEMLENWYGVAL